MHGPVPAPSPHHPRARGTVLALRVLFVAATVLSLGFLAWAAMLRAALVQRRPLGWWLFAGQVTLFIGTCVLIVSFPETDWRTNLGVGLLLLQIAGVVAYYLAVDLRAERTPAHAAPPTSPHYPAAPFSPLYAPPPYPVPPGAAPGNPYATTAGAAQPPQPAPPAPYAPEHRPPPPPPQRIDQVRAELDELSDYLRKEQGR
ncbi:hypothetical protein [Streptomyces sp. S186]|uniref:hypothetical protein n=1 Tax=Streptomyces sp. S186 TaxID=3434395 RepID=UPI003F66D53D